MSTSTTPAINMDKLNAFIGQFVPDLGASVHAGMVLIGEKLGLYKALAEKLMAKAFPNSEFFGFDYHDKSIEAARESARAAGVAGRVRFEVAKAKEFAGRKYDFVAVFDCLHDMGDPIGVAAHVRQSLPKEGTWMIVEPYAHNQFKDNLNPVGRVMYSFSTLLCTPCSRSQEVGLCLGAQAGEGAFASW